MCVCVCEREREKMRERERRDVWIIRMQAGTVYVTDVMSSGKRV